MGMNLQSIILLLLFSFRLAAAETKPLDFDEVFNVIRTNVSDVSETELRQNSAMGLIKEMGTRVQIVTTNAEPADQSPDAITRRSVYENQFGYIRIRSVDDRLPSDFRQSLTQLIQSNKLNGVILDLRYAEGASYEAAAEVADQFVDGGRPLLGLGPKRISSTAQSPTVRLPLAILVNGETRAGAEAFGEERIGLVREGWNADLAVLPRGVSWENPARETMVDLTIAAGRVVHAAETLSPLVSPGESR